MIPAAVRAFPSTLGATSTPFARPGQLVTLQREAPVFSREPGDNRITLVFEPVGGPTTRVKVSEVLAPGACAPDACTGSLCRCVSFRFPDTDALLGEPGDGVGLAGPVEIRARLRGTETARIDTLRIPGSSFRDDVFPSFVALPPTTAVAFLADGQDVRAAADEDGNLFVPLDFTGAVLNDGAQTGFVEAVVPIQAPLDRAALASYTLEGQRLPTLVRRRPDGSLIGTIDSPVSVLRIEAGARLAPLVAAGPGGPLLIPGVVASADPRRRADGLTLQIGERFAVFESRECGPLDPPETCRDVNGDGDLRDRILQALDLTDPRAEPIVLDAIDVSTLAAVPAFSLYAFDASDDVVVFRIPEVALDLDGDGVTGEQIRSGAYDLRRRASIPLADGAPRAELDGSLLAFSVTVEPNLPLDVLAVYDAAREPPGPFLVADAANPGFVVNRFEAGAIAFPSIPFDFAVDAGRVAFLVPELLQGADLTGEGSFGETALLWLDEAFAVHNPMQPVLPPSLGLRAGLLTFDVGGVGVLDTDPGAGPPFLICADAFRSPVVPSFSRTLIPCAKAELGVRDLNGDGDAADDDVLHVVLPDAPGGPVERNLGLALFTQFDPLVRGDTLVAAVDEQGQNADLDGDGVIGGGSPASPYGPFVLHAFHASTQRLINFREDVAVSTPPYLQAIEDGLVFISGSLVRTVFRDLDGDGHFEELYEDPVTGEQRIADNCPREPNPGQEDGDGDGVGDACDEDALCAGLGAGPCRVHVDRPSATFDDLQAAVDAAADGATLRVEGVCAGPVRIRDRSGLTIRGEPPAGGSCRAEGPGRLDLRSTVVGGDEVLRIQRSSEIDVRFLNVVGGSRTGVDVRDSEGVDVQCSCIARNGAGLALARSAGGRLRQSLVTTNAGDGIRLLATDGYRLRHNRVAENQGDGIAIGAGSDRNRVRANRVERNAGDGISVHRSDENRVIANQVLRNGRDPARDAGVELWLAAGNRVHANEILANADGRVDAAACRAPLLASSDNSGGNLGPACRPGTLSSRPEPLGPTP